VSHLSLRLFGAFQAALNGDPITGFESVKTQALLAYLVLEADRPHSRLKLAGLLWPERPDATARNNLRHALSTLRRAIGDRGPGLAASETSPLLMVRRETVQFSRAGDCWVDVHAFRSLIADGVDRSSVTSLGEAISLYRGDLLEGFYVSESPVFEDWMLLMRDRLQRQAASELRNLVAETARRGDHDAAGRYAWHWVELEPWQEEAHRQLMQVLAMSGRRTEALAQFEACRRTLQDEFGIDPSGTTSRMFEQIRDGTFVPKVLTLRQIVTVLPGADQVSRDNAGLPRFVARERELAQLDQHLRAAGEGRSHAVFVTGEAGYGKTALLQAFARRAQAADPQLVVMGGSCNAYTGVGDPYSPFREILEQAADGGDTAATEGWSDEGRLPRVQPIAIQALLAHGRDLIGVFVPASTLKRCVSTGEALKYGWAAELREAIERVGAKPPGSVAQDDLFEQYTALIRAISQQVPLVLVLDDLQWADLGSTSLLFHLGRRLGRSRVLLLGAYRPEELALGRNSERHPLMPVIHEFKRDWGDTEIDLHLAESRRFMEALLANEPNALGAQFGETLLRRTGGHALYTVELLRGMQVRGDLIQDTEGRWIEGPMLNWDVLPSRVEAVIAERVDRLPASLREMLRWASVEGEIFTAEIVARSMGGNLQETIASLSGELDRRHRLVRAQGVQQMAGRRISRYRFRHILFQTYLYNSLDEVEHVHLHEQVGRTLEGLYQGSDDALAAAAPQLAWHFERAAMADEAVRYCELAGQRAIRMLAYQEAIAHLTRGLELLEQLPASPERDRREVGIRLAIASPIMILQSWGAPELVDHYGRVEELATRSSDIPRQLQLMSLVRGYYLTRAEHQRAIESARQSCALAERLEDPCYISMVHAHWSIALMFLGDFASSRTHIHQVLALFDREAFNALGLVSTGGDPEVGTLIFAAYTYWYLGYPDQALQVSKRALALAKSLDDPLSIVLALGLKNRVHRWLRDVWAVEALIETLHRTWTEYHMPLGAANALQDRAWVLSERGQPEEGIPLYRQGLETWAASGMCNHMTEFHGVLAEMHGRAGQPEEGLRLIAKAMAFMERTEERYHEAELYRLRGELLLLQDKDNALRAADDFRRAIEVAQRQSAKMLELRAAMSLCNLWRKLASPEALWRTQGAPEELAKARQYLAEVYDWFTEGFNTRDLQEAKRLLDSAHP
jgi:DNA-binding SARP family transcriptional activator/tetratricopeptide (TPR) repeat protein